MAIFPRLGALLLTSIVVGLANSAIQAKRRSLPLDGEDKRPSGLQIVIVSISITTLFFSGGCIVVYWLDAFERTVNIANPVAEYFLYAKAATFIGGLAGTASIVAAWIAMRWHKNRKA